MLYDVVCKAVRYGCFDHFGGATLSLAYEMMCCRKNQPEGLEVDDGTFELENLMEVWGKAQGDS